MYDIAVIPIGLPGTGKRSWNLPGSYQIAGITIDNPSGSWLYLPQDNTYIAPYILGFAHSFAPTQTRVDVLFSAGPAGQVSTQLGDRPVAQIYDAPVQESAGQVSSAGSSFIEQFTPVLIAVNATQQVPLSSGLAGTLVAAVATRRIRLLTLDARLGFSNVSGIYPICGLNFVVQDNSGSGQALIGRLSPEKPSSERAYPAGVDFALGASVIFSAGADWADLLMLLSITYQVI